MIDTFREFRSFLYPYRRALGLGGVLAVVEVALALAQPWPLTYVIDHVLAPAAGIGRPDRVDLVLAIAVAAQLLLVAVTAFVDYWSTRLLSSAGLHVATDLRERVFGHLNRLSLRFHGENRVGDLAARVTGDIDRTQELLVQTFAVLAPNLVLVVGMFTVMVLIDLTFTLVALAVTPLLVIVVTRATTDLKRAARRARKADGQLAAAASESLSAIHLVQAFAIEPVQEEQLGRLSRHSLDAGLESVRLQARFSPSVDIAGAVSVGAVLWFGAHRVLAGELTLGGMLVFLSYLGSLYKPVKALAKLSSVVAKGVSAAERVTDVLGESPAIDDAPGARTAPRLRGRIEFRNVSFSYGREPVLDGFQLTVEPGETVALVGPTGAGKSTIASLVARLADPTDGAVAVDGVDLRAFTTASLRRQISMVLQDPVLLSGTLRDNIAIGRPHARPEEIDRAAGLALVTEFSSRLPLGLDTPIGERGANLSGGQRQRVAIARAILRDAPVLILDEPTSALDAESEELIVQALAALPSGRTTIVIAHRLSTVQRADRIVVLDRGRVVEIGRHEDLIAHGGRYADLARRQHLVGSGPAALAPHLPRTAPEDHTHPAARTTPRIHTLGTTHHTLPLGGPR